MNIDRLFERLSAIQALSRDSKDALSSELKFVAFPKGHQLIQAQSFAHHIFFLEKGFAVSYLYRANKRVVTNLWKEGEIILLPRSFFQQIPTDEIVEVTTDADLYLLSQVSVSRLINRFPEGNVLIRSIIIELHDKCEQRILDVHTLSAWERYMKLVHSYPGVEMRVSQDLIASYLNITPQSLSRLKATHR